VGKGIFDEQVTRVAGQSHKTDLIQMVQEKKY
jgi:hypothetical protein